MDRTVEDLGTYNNNNKYLSWFGRINVLKLDTMLRLLNVFQALPIKQWVNIEVD